MSLTSKITYAVATFLFTGVLALGFLARDAAAAGATNITLQILPVCGNGIIEIGEQCDGANLGGASCESRGFASGTLSCLPDCTGFETAACVPFAGNNNGGGNPPTPPSITSISLSGWAQPYGSVSLFKDGQRAAKTTTYGDAAFSITINGLSSGRYVFGVQAEDANGLTTSMTTFSSSLVAGTFSYVSNLFLSPTLQLDKNTVLPGESFTVSGYSVPGAEIFVATYPEKELIATVRADADGRYAAIIDTSGWKAGPRALVAKASLKNVASDLSRTVELAIGTGFSVPAPDSGPGSVVKRADLNGDGRVDLVDFSILTFWFRKALSPEFLALEKEFLSGDGKIDLVDFSIVAYAWTG